MLFYVLSGMLGMLILVFGGAMVLFARKYKDGRSDTLTIVGSVIMVMLGVMVLVFTFRQDYKLTWLFSIIGLVATLVVVIRYIIVHKIRS